MDHNDRNTKNILFCLFSVLLQNKNEREHFCAENLQKQGSRGSSQE